jgi:hypothetical protein
MKYRFLAVFSLVSATFALADVPEASSARSDFQRDKALIEALVTGALDLARENDPLKRAQQCNLLAGFLTREIQEATRKRQGPRAAELGQMLQSMLMDGIADNLNLAGADAPGEGARAQEILKFSESMAATVAKPLKDAVEQLPPQEQEAMQPVLDVVKKVQKASQGQSQKSTKNKKSKK